MTLEEELGEQYRQKGLDTALTHYRDLKAKYLQKGAYDFTDRSLNNFGDDVLARNDTPGAIRIFLLNAELFPEVGRRVEQPWRGLCEGRRSEESNTRIPARREARPCRRWRAGGAGEAALVRPTLRLPHVAALSLGLTHTPLMCNCDVYADEPRDR